MKLLNIALGGLIATALASQETVQSIKYELQELYKMSQLISMNSET